LNHQFQIDDLEALKAAQPAPLGAGEITARLGAAWIPLEVIEAFARFLVPRYRGHVKYLAPTAQWVVDLPHADVVETVEASVTGSVAKNILGHTRIVDRSPLGGDLEEARNELRLPYRISIP